ncbi:MAG: RdgB/HAM1 family non-canonical purine NTP pyrophosphatase [Bacteroidales bacterium]|nr:RdgB/HAM1 family non-canonical purine NTP pyrophosphatase [Bacteroidales bacterium]MBQ4306132.1 RdgB/HAM1 family non-canonical purine NTP pyrophosphatase [Bacteroidales bacterium]MBQ5944021.1 RdgB/HAM1 family non-canonical purine NTP pyrophosphatase [Bacteroidales bacterium]
MKIIFATANKGKLREAGEILGNGWELVSPAEMGITEDIEETGETLKDNSLLKATCIHEKTGLDCFADDTGLEVDALGGAPGVHTARYAGEGHDFQANMDKLLAELGDSPSRTARFRSVVTLILDGKAFFFDGRLEGRIAFSKSGNGGFGYDPVFIPDELPSNDGGLVPNTDNLTLADIPEEDKNAISHRGKALRMMAAFLKEREK